MDQELSYLLKRAEEERIAARRAATPEAQKAHEMLAAQYEATRSDCYAKLGVVDCLSDAMLRFEHPCLLIQFGGHVLKD